MRYKFIAATVGFLVVGALAVAGTQDAGATVPMNPAEIYEGFGCGFPDADGGYVYTDATMAVITSNNGTMRCQADGVPNSTGKASVTSGFGCFTPAGITDKTHLVISASGQATLTCQVK